MFEVTALLMGPCLLPRSGSMVLDSGYGQLFSRSHLYICIHGVGKHPSANLYLCGILELFYYY